MNDGSDVKEKDIQFRLLNTNSLMKLKESEIQQICT